MINERIALVMLEGEIPTTEGDPRHTKQYYRAIQGFAIATIHLCEQGKFIKLERYLSVALKLFREGNETVKDGITKVYLYTLSHTLDKQSGSQWIEVYMPGELKREITRQHYTSAL